MYVDLRRRSVAIHTYLYRQMVTAFEPAAQQLVALCILLLAPSRFTKAPNRFAAARRLTWASTPIGRAKPMYTMTEAQACTAVGEASESISTHECIHGREVANLPGV